MKIYLNTWPWGDDVAGDWIKMRTNLRDDPRVMAIAERAGLDVDAVVGKLFVLWSYADTHSTNGFLPHATPVTLASLLRNADVIKACADVGWLVFDEGGARIPRFAEHNGESAKRRALASKRAAKHRENAAKAGNAPVTQPSRSKRDESAPREDKRGDKREEKKEGEKKDDAPAASSDERKRLFDAVQEVTGLDAELRGSLIGKTVAELLRGKPPYTPEEVRGGAAAHWRTPKEGCIKASEVVDAASVFRNSRQRQRPPPGKAQHPGTVEGLKIPIIRE